MTSKNTLSKTLFSKLPDPEDWLHWEEAQALWDIANKANGSMVEIGSYEGRSSVLLGTVAKKKNTNLTCIDPWDSRTVDSQDPENVFKSFIRNTRGLPVIFIRLPLEEVDPIKSDFVYCDGDHSKNGTKRQLEWALKCSPSYIAIHDYGTTGGQKDVADACKQIMKREPDKVIDRLAIYEISRNS